MALNTWYFHAFLPIVLITRKSWFFVPALLVLLATIKYFGGCPCPRCLIEKSQIPDMGTKADMRCRQNIREDTPWYRYIINLVRCWIFERGYLVAGEGVAKNLKAKSWVPTRVSGFLLFGFDILPLPNVECLFKVGAAWVQLFYHVRARSAPRGGARWLEISFHAFDSNFTCRGCRCCGKI